MKKIFFITAISAMILCSCRTTTYTPTLVNFHQVAQTAPVDKHTVVSQEGAYTYEDENCKISLDLWDKGGAINFCVLNKTKEILYIDLQNCYLVKNGASNNTFSFTAVIDSKTNLITANPTEQGIAPGATYSFSGINLGYERLTSCDWDAKPKRSRPSIHLYDVENSPAVFANYISYRIGEKKTLHTAVAKFYIRSVSNYRSKDIIDGNTTYTTDCKGSATNVEYNQYKYSPATGFYVTYTEYVTE